MNSPRNNGAGVQNNQVIAAISGTANAVFSENARPATRDATASSSADGLAGPDEAQVRDQRQHGEQLLRELVQPPPTTAWPAG